MSLSVEKPDSAENFRKSSEPYISPTPSKELPEYDDILAAKHLKTSLRDEFVRRFFSILAVHKVKSYESTECLKPRVKEPDVQNEPPPKSTEDVQPAEIKVGKCVIKKKPTGKKRKSSRKSGTGKSVKSSKQSITLSETKIASVESGTGSIKEGSQELGEIPEGQEEPSDKSKEDVPAKEEEFDPNTITCYEQDQIAEIHFKSGNTYSGRLSMMKMEGEGMYVWADGTVYRGTFYDGQATGTGTLDWPSEKHYEGQLFCGHRHGVGFTLNKPHGQYHFGHWYLGAKHGKGCTVYGPNSFYEGEWANGLPNGFGKRNYSSGSCYVGMWRNGRRHGKGTMVWANNDVYEGDWKYGYMDGKGTYIWSDFKNEYLAYPLMNMYEGEWRKGCRHGIGRMKLSSGAVIETVWVNNLKHGCGTVYCVNGSVIKGHPMFVRDRGVSTYKDHPETRFTTLKKKIVEFVENEYSKKGRHTDCKTVDLDSVWETGVKRCPHNNAHLKAYTSKETFFIPIHSPAYTMKLIYHFHHMAALAGGLKLHLPSAHHEADQRNIYGTKGDGDVLCHYFDDELERKAIVSLPRNEAKKRMYALEEKWFHKVLTDRMGDLTKLYNYYATMHCEGKPPYYPVLMRFQLWQLLTNSGINETGLSQYILQTVVGKTSNPFSPVLLSEVIQYLLILSWELCLLMLDRDEDIMANFAESFDTYLNYYAMPGLEKGVDPEMKLLNEVPLQPLYKFFQSLRPTPNARSVAGILHSFGKTKNLKHHHKVLQSLKGKNVMNPNGTMEYKVEVEPSKEDNPREHARAKESIKSLRHIDFSILGAIGCQQIQKIVDQVCPAREMSGLSAGTGYQTLTFAEFALIIVKSIQKYYESYKETQETYTFQEIVMKMNEVKAKATKTKPEGKTQKLLRRRRKMKKHKSEEESDEEALEKKISRLPYSSLPMDRLHPTVLEVMNRKI